MSDYEVIVLGGGAPGEHGAAALAARGLRAHVPLEVLSDTIQPFPSFSGIYDVAMQALRMQITEMPRPVGLMDAQMATLSR